MGVDWDVVWLMAAIVVPVSMAGMIFWRWFDSRPHRFKDCDGNLHTWHPGGRFTDHAGMTVTDPRRIKNLQRAWDEWRSPSGYPGA